jgi:hypothetical protein
LIQHPIRTQSRGPQACPEARESQATLSALRRRHEFCMALADAIRS